MKPTRPTYQVLIKRAAWREIMALNDRLQERVFAAIEDLESEPRPSGVTKLQGFTDAYRIRVGDYRVIYEIQDDVLIVVVVKVGHRRDVYR